MRQIMFIALIYAFLMCSMLLIGNAPKSTGHQKKKIQEMHPNTHFHCNARVRAPDFGLHWAMETWQHGAAAPRL